MASIERYAVMGQPISHSLSPTIHQLFAQQVGESIQYEAIEVPTGNLQQAIEQFRDEGGRGLNITVPHKQTAFELIEHVHDHAKAAGAVNTIGFYEDGLCWGDNTDGVGLVNDLTNNLNLTITNQQLLILGAGGAVAGILGPLLALNPASITIINRTLSTAQQLIARFGVEGIIDVYDYDHIPENDYQLIINATSAHLQSTQLLLPESIIHNETTCYDLMYGAELPFLVWASEMGAKQCSDGLGMLVEQAAESFYLWRGIKPETQTILQSLKNNQ